MKAWMINLLRQLLYRQLELSDMNPILNVKYIGLSIPNDLIIYSSLLFYVGFITNLFLLLILIRIPTGGSSFHKIAPAFRCLWLLGSIPI